ncbi:juvenile hormone acid O-methyltransferase [Hylaeus anthracinus]|uniref:juvenile hormone acid O-methyltransferase n=1 Tax=Hylaeus volcanicus TaxID=313075 RepID=UPI0023B774CC|nr:juvenile hormone acid O-methyltransferase [Hylaeus volcanicus]XP_054003188.1 juvenile hormone acid O-methyltransferase [Hylaeus anthracinus]
MNMVEEYVNTSKLQYQDAIDIIDEFHKEISETRGKCIDVGCGPGDVTKNLLLPKLPSGVEVVGSDISKSMIEYARQKYQGEKRLSFTCLDIQTEELPNEHVEQYHGLFSFFCFHWCQNMGRTFENVWKMLRPGGTALAMFLASTEVFNAYEKLHKNPRYKPYMQDVDRFVPYFHRCKDPRAAFRKILEDIGFEILHCSRRDRTFIFRNSQSLKDFMIPITPFVSRIPDQELQNEFMDALMREITVMKIQFSDEDYSDQRELGILGRYQLLVAYIKKPCDVR